MQRFLLTSFYILLGLQLHANPETSLIATATMQVDEARYNFEEVSQAMLTLTSTDGVGPTGILLEYGDKQKVELAIKETETDSCGCLSYFASLPDQNLNGLRFSVFLEDHTASSCSHNVGNSWKAVVRSGFGWCGTMDSTMALSGFPVFHNN